MEETQTEDINALSEDCRYNSVIESLPTNCDALDSVLSDIKTEKGKQKFFQKCKNSKFNNIFILSVFESFTNSYI